MTTIPRIREYQTGHRIVGDGNGGIQDAWESVITIDLGEVASLRPLGKRTGRDIGSIITLRGAGQSEIWINADYAELRDDWCAVMGET